jgi:hypothetical protein
MTLDEQIISMEELLSDDDHWSCENAKTEYRQLQEWLKDYKRLLEMPKGDLVSREAIKKIVVEMLAKWSDGYCYIELPTDDAIKEMKSAIDNAPTVKITDYDTCYQDGVEDGLNDIRPQGKWVYNKEMSITCSLWNCSVCNRLNGNDYFNFCPNCGSQMQKGGAE